MKDKAAILAMVALVLRIKANGGARLNVRFVRIEASKK
jgi:hypothetical protein